MRKINEIFYSLQGEGAHTGIPSVFIRFSGCNLACPFCDTQHQNGVLMSDDEIIRKVNTFPAKWIVLTGGEPALHIDAEFVKRLREETGKKVAIETNGTVKLPQGIDWITVSPKEGICGDGYSPGVGRVVVEKADEIKVVDVGQSLSQYFDFTCRQPSTLMYLQPCYVNDEKERDANRQRTVNRVLEDPRWQLSLQTHRILGID